ncbi:MAG: hypothetical protein ABJB66_10615 [Gemmatimonadaceae bacterium]
MTSTTLSTSSRSDAVSSAQSIPWHLAAVVFAATSVLVGLIWDISWHMSIGRDTFWTPAHLAIYTGGAVAGLASGYEVLRRSFFAPNESKDNGVTVWRIFRGPLGGWLCIWGAVAMLTSAPFDDWWHNAYGLDVQILSPPHSVLAVGFLAILMGATVLAVARQSQEGSTSSSWVVAYTSGLVLTIASVMATEYQDRVMMHMGIFYEVASFVFPLFLLTAAGAVKLRWPATIAAGVYTAIMCAQLWILPLFEASPLLGPIRQPVTHMVPLNFPLLVLLPAFLIDVVLHRTVARGAWYRAFFAGATFVISFTVLQWFFAYFLMSPASDNWLFHSRNLAYMLPSDTYEAKGLFVNESVSSLIIAFGVSIVLATIAARFGAARGRWLSAVQR